jgi:hypothetical protein
MADLPYRDLESICAKWKALKNMKKPTGDPDCPLNVVRAQTIAREIENGAGLRYPFQPFVAAGSALVRPQPTAAFLDSSRLHHLIVSARSVQHEVAARGDLEH